MMMMCWLRMKRKIECFSLKACNHIPHVHIVKKIMNEMTIKVIYELSTHQTSLSLHMAAVGAVNGGIMQWI